MKNLVFTAILTVSFIGAYAQPAIEWQKALGGANQDNGHTRTIKISKQ